MMLCKSIFYSFGGVYLEFFHLSLTSRLSALYARRRLGCPLGLLLCAAAASFFLAWLSRCVAASRKSRCVCSAACHSAAICSASSRNSAMVRIPRFLQIACKAASRFGAKYCRKKSSVLISSRARASTTDILLYIYSLSVAVWLAVCCAFTWPLVSFSASQSLVSLVFA